MEDINAQFLSLQEIVLATIDSKIDEIVKIIGEMQKLSEESGIPFDYQEYITGEKLRYVPNSFEEKFLNLDQKLIGKFASGRKGKIGYEWEYGIH